MSRAWLVAPLLLPLLTLIACGNDDSERVSTPTITAAATSTAVAATAPAAPPTQAATVTAAPPASGPPAGAPPPLQSLPPAPPGSITLGAVGDVSLAREVVDRMAVYGAAYPYALIAPALSSDIVLGNLEGALTDRGDPWPKGYNFRTPPQYAPGLRNAGFDVVSLANNHTLDYGVIGLQDTMAALDAVGVRYAGAGNDDAAARAPVMLEANGLRVAILAYADSPTEGGGFAIRDWAAGPGTPGMAIGDPAVVAADVAAAKARADFVIVTAHAGSEYVNAPNATQRAIAEAALAAGADAYIGHHAHVVQPVEQRGGQFIAWGLGNFIFDLDEVDLANIPQPRVTLVLQLTLTPGAGVTAWHFVPLVQDAEEDRPRPATEAEAAVLRGLLTP